MTVSTRANPEEGFQNALNINSNRVVLAEEAGSLFLSSSAGTNTFSLPPLTAALVGARFGFSCVSGAIIIDCDGSDVIKGALSGVAGGVQSSEAGSFIEIIGATTGIWYTKSGASEWSEVGDDTNRYYFGGDKLSNMRVTSSSTTLDEGDREAAFFGTTGGDDPVVFTLPSAPSTGYVVSVGVYRNTQRVRVIRSGSDNIVLPNNISVTQLESEKEATVVKLCYMGSNVWHIVGGSGEWYDDWDTPTAGYNMDGNFLAGTSGNYVSFDDDGNLADSGDAIGDFCEDTFVEWQFVPVGDMIDGSTPPGSLQTISAGNGKIEIRAFSGTADNILLVPWEVPADFTGGAIQFRVVGWISSETTPESHQGIYFALRGYSIAMGENLSGTFGTPGGSYVEDLVAQGCDTTYDRFITTLNTEITVTGIAANETAMLELYRDVSDAIDNYTEAVGVSGIWIGYSRVPAGVSS